MYALRTRYLGPTATKPARIGVTLGVTKKPDVSYDHTARTEYEQHRRAASYTINGQFLTARLQGCEFVHIPLEVA